jgi:hypothetical protein
VPSRFASLGLNLTGDATHRSTLTPTLAPHRPSEVGSQRACTGRAQGCRSAPVLQQIWVQAAQKIISSVPAWYLRVPGCSAGSMTQPSCMPAGCVLARPLRVARDRPFMCRALRCSRFSTRVATHPVIDRFSGCPVFPKHTTNERKGTPEVVTLPAIEGLEGHSFLGPLLCGGYRLSYQGRDNSTDQRHASECAALRCNLVERHGRSSDDRW